MKEFGVPLWNILCQHLLQMVICIPYAPAILLLSMTRNKWTCSSKNAHRDAYASMTQNNKTGTIPSVHQP